MRPAALAPLRLPVALLAAPVVAAGPPTDEAEDVGARIAEVQAALAALEADPSLDEASKATARATYERALEQLRQAADFEARLPCVPLEGATQVRGDSVVRD